MSTLPLQAPILPVGVGLRYAQEGDEPFLRRLFVDHRLAEWALVPWPDEAKRAFLDTQFDFQQRHYAAHYVGASVLIVSHDQRDIGSLHLHATPRDLRIVDILVDVGERGRGIGSAVLRWVQHAARHMAADRVSLNVGLQDEAVRRLYEKHGFVAGETQGAHLAMRWPVDVRTVSS